MSEEMLTHSEILSQGTFDNFSNYLGDIVPNTHVFVYMKTRDSDILERVNYDEIKNDLESFPSPENEDNEYSTIYEHTINHWACGWVTYLFVQKNTPAHSRAKEILEKLSNYPVFNEDTYREAEQTEAQEIWERCYSISDRISYVKKYRSQFEFRSYSELIDNIRGKYFSGYAYELIQ